MSYNTIERNANGQIVLCTAYGSWYGCGRTRSAQETANLMTASDMEKLLIESGGDFSRFDPETAQAIAIKAKELAEKRQEREKKQKEYRAQKRQEKHENIMSEIRSLCSDIPSFTPSQIQLLAAKRGGGFPVRTRQMYSKHLSTARKDGEVQRVYDSFTTVYVVYADGKSGTQNVRRKDGGFVFVR